MLPPGNQCSIWVTFTPTATGLFTGTLRIDDDSSQTPEKIKLSGTGVPPQLISIAITPASPAIAAGLSQQFAATGYFNNGTTQDLTSSATWTSSTTGIAAIAGCDRRDEDVGATELEVDARLALLHAADDLGAENALEPLRGRLRVRAAQVDVIPGVGRHFLVSPVCLSSVMCVARMERSVIRGAASPRNPRITP